MPTDIYRSGQYAASNPSYHTEDSPWKAGQIARLLDKHGLRPRSIAEIGCGAGQVIAHLSREPALRGATFRGYDISPDAIALAQREASDVTYVCGDMVALAPPGIDLLLSIDVFEHVPDYMGFLERCRPLAKHHVLHIPLDLHVSAVLRGSFLASRADVGHLHYFTADSALATLRDTGYRIEDVVYTNPSRDLLGTHPSFRKVLANVPRALVGAVSVPASARLFGGYCLLVLARGG